MHPSKFLNLTGHYSDNFLHIHHTACHLHEDPIWFLDRKWRNPLVSSRMHILAISYTGYLPDAITHALYKGLPWGRKGICLLPRLLAPRDCLRPYSLSPFLYLNTPFGITGCYKWKRPQIAHFRVKDSESQGDCEQLQITDLVERCGTRSADW